MFANVFSVTAFRKPIPNPFLVLPDILTALIKSTLLGEFVISSL